jgi:hypothetical protein
MSFGSGSIAISGSDPFLFPYPKAITSLKGAL